MAGRKTKIKVKLQVNAGKIRKVWKIKPNARIRDSRKQSLKDKIKDEEAKEWS